MALLLMKMRLFICATSTRRSVPAAISLAASSSAVGISRSRAKWLSVPSGRIPSNVPVPTSAEAAAAIVPSPPPTISNGSPRSATARQRTSHSPPSTSSTSPVSPAPTSAAATFSAISESAAAAPPPRLIRTETRAMPALTHQRRLAILAGAFADPLRIDVHLHAHVACAAAALAGHVHRVVGRRIAAGHVRGLRVSFGGADHLNIDLAAAHGKVAVATGFVLAGEEILLRLLRLLLRQAALARLLLVRRHLLLHAVGVLRRNARDLHFLNGDLRLPQARLDHRVARHHALLADRLRNLVAGGILEIDFRSFVAGGERADTGDHADGIFHLSLPPTRRVAPLQRLHHMRSQWRFKSAPAWPSRRRRASSPTSPRVRRRRKAASASPSSRITSPRATSRRRSRS